jgi:hypothetical protein
MKAMIDEIENEVYAIYQKIGIDKPLNHDEIVEFITNDVQECTFVDEWTSEDVLIAFRRFIENKSETF